MSRRRKTTMIMLAGGLALTMILAACGSDEPAPAAGGSGASEPGASEPGQDATIQTGETDLGTILTDADGRTLYMFGADENGESACYDECAATWPALTVDGDPVAGEGLDAAKLGTTERTDGSVQVTYAGLPLYSFANDATPGETNGQGLGEIWFVVSPEGEKITDLAPPPGYST